MHATRTHTALAYRIIRCATEQEAVAKMADHTAYDLRYSYRTEPPKMCVWNPTVGHVTTLPIAIPDAEISAVRFLLCVVADR